MGLTEAAANALADQYGLIPSRVETLVSAPGATQASSEVGNFTRIVNGVPRFVSTTVRASVYGLGDLEYALSLIRQMNAAGGRYAVAGVSTRGGSTINADGGLYDLAAGRLWKSYASGGVASLPSIGWQQPQIQPNRGPAGIQWSETGAGPWEAYTSGHPLEACPVEGHHRGSGGSPRRAGVVGVVRRGGHSRRDDVHNSERRLVIIFPHWSSTWLSSVPPSTGQRCGSGRWTSSRARSRRNWSRLTSRSV